MPHLYTVTGFLIFKCTEGAGVGIIAGGGGGGGEPVTQSTRSR